VTLDTFREDAAGAGGDARARTPWLDRLARGGVQFRGIAASPLTLPSHASMLTGLDGPAHGVRDNGTFRLAPGVPTLVPALREKGFATGAFVTAFPLDARFGLSPGFDVYDDEVGGPQGGGFVMGQRSGSEGAAAADRWLAGLPSPARWFAWLHLFDAHQPYDAPAPLVAATGDPYRADVAMADAWLGRAVRAVIDRDAWIVVLGDHGESLGDHGEGTHGLFLYGATIRVPAILWPAPPGETPGPRRDVFRSIDLPATAFELLGFAPEEAPGNGASVLALGARPAFMETLYPFLHFGWSRLSALEEGDWKYVEAPERELYDLARDPGEVRNVAADHPEQAERMAEELREVAARERPLDAIELAPAERQALESLGYATSQAERAGRHPDPKRMIVTANLLEQAQALMSRGDWDAALLPLRGALARDPRNKDLHQMLGIVHAAKGRHAQAADSFLRCLELPPHANDRVPRFELAKAYLRLGKSAEAAAHLESVLETDPDDASAWYNLGVARDRGGDRAGAEAAWRRALELDPASAVAQEALEGRRGTDPLSR
jgi:tetratricopeptide (TPR) repeat protein